MLFRGAKELVALFQNLVLLLNPVLVGLNFGILCVSAVFNRLYRLCLRRKEVYGILVFWSLVWILALQVSMF